MLDYYADVNLDHDTLVSIADETLTRPSDAAFWDERLYTTHGGTISWAERGDDILAESNYKCVLEFLRGIANDADAQDDVDDYVIDATCSHWAVGSLRQIYVRVYDDNGEFTAVFRYAAKIGLDLRDYPVFDESDFSERELEEYYRQFDDAISYARSEYERANDCDISDEDHARISDVVQTMASDGDTRLEYNGPDVDYSGVSEAYAEVTNINTTTKWDAYARTLDNPLGESQLTLI